MKKILLTFSAVLCLFSAAAAKPDIGEEPGVMTYDCVEFKMLCNATTRFVKDVVKGNDEEIFTSIERLKQWSDYNLIRHFLNRRVIMTALGPKEAKTEEEIAESMAQLTYLVKDAANVRLAYKILLSYSRYITLTREEIQALFKESVRLFDKEPVTFYFFKLMVDEGVIPDTNIMIDLLYFTPEEGWRKKAAMDYLLDSGVIDTAQAGLLILHIDARLQAAKSVRRIKYITPIGAKDTLLKVGRRENKKFRGAEAEYFKNLRKRFETIMTVGEQRS
jgi:hypothetical protein